MDIQWPFIHINERFLAIWWSNILLFAHSMILESILESKARAFAIASGGFAWRSMDNPWIVYG